MSEYTYKAFISYSWADAKWGKWLQHAVETYRTPKTLIEKHAPAREIPARLTPLFKDREEQAAGASIGASIEAALADSEFLIVICSPNSAKSQWVNHEIAWFKTNRNPDKILALIVDGEPGDESRECFPKALTHKIAPDLSITDEPDEAPLAADAREGGDGKRLAKLKLVAAMLGVGLDQLLRRDDRRRVVRARVVTAASLALALVMSGLTWFAVEQRNEAQFQRDEAETLIENSLTEMRDQLEPVGRLDLLEGLGSRALEYYAAQKLDALDADALGRRARAMLLVGEVSNIRGNSEEALQAFTEAAATTQEQLARDPDNEQRIFDHAQSVFWVGYIAYNRGELDNAEAQFREYKRLADRLIELNPDKPEWQMESSYAEGNLGTMYYAQERFEEAEPAFANALRMVEKVAEGSEFDPAQQIEIGLASNWLGLATDRLGKLSESLALHQREVEIYDEILQRDPANASAKNRLAIALQFLAERQLQLGEIDTAIRTLSRSLAVSSDLRRVEANNSEWQETEVGGQIEFARMLLHADRLVDSKAMFEEASQKLERMIAKDPSNQFWSRSLEANRLTLRAEALLKESQYLQARDAIERSISLLDGGTEKSESGRRVIAKLIAGDIERALGNSAQAEKHWREALAQLPDHPAMDDERYRLKMRLGQTDDLPKLRSALDRRGYRHPAYLRER